MFGIFGRRKRRENAAILLCGAICGSLSVQKRRLSDEPELIAALRTLGCPERYIQRSEAIGDQCQKVAEARS